VQWGSFEVLTDQPIEWRHDNDTAVAKLGNGKAAEVVLKRCPGNSGDAPVVIHNLKYWGTPRRSGKATARPNGLTMGALSGPLSPVLGGEG
jgi:hypothetical protein